VMKKLTEIGYVEVVRSEKDKRMKFLYLTEKGVPAAKRIKEIHSNFYKILCSNIHPSDIQRTEQTYEKSSLNEPV
ncbi:MAG: winged helix DNA-binding protein, partial [Clostridiales bacterium]|nr:winged helix DNA-binding protein [Clostridiales bacterium]